MNREIKFRGLFESINGIKAMVYGNYIKSYCDGQEYHEIEHSHFEDFKKWTVDTNTISQYTGLKDKNGVEIYEGDVVALAYLSTGEIYFTGKVVNHEHAGITVDTSNDYMEFGLKNYSYEVIGNIHQNPDLIK